MRIEEQPYDDRHNTAPRTRFDRVPPPGPIKVTPPAGRISEGAMDRNYEAPKIDAWGKRLPMASDIQERDFELLLGPNDKLGVFVKACIVQTESKVPGREVMSWTSKDEGALITPNGHLWRITMHAEPARLDYFGDLVSVHPPSRKNGWLVYDDGGFLDAATVWRVQFFVDNGRGSERPVCSMPGCERENVRRWATIYPVEDFGCHVPTGAAIVEIRCESCAAPDASGVEFMEETA